MTPTEAKEKIESFFGSVDPNPYDSRFAQFPKSNDPEDGYRLAFETFSQNGRHELGIGDITLRDSPEEALSEMVSHVEQNASKDARLFWRQYPKVESRYDITVARKMYCATCRITWFSPNNYEEKGED